MFDQVMQFLTVYPNIVVSDFLRYFLAAAPIAAIIFWLKPARLMQRKLQTRTITRTAMGREFRYSVLTATIFALNGYLVFLGIEHDVLRLYDGPSQHGWLWFAFSFPLILIVHDAYFYWTHRAMHHPKLFRYFHRTHHKSHTPSPWAAYAFDPGEAFVQAVFFPIYLLIFPTNGIVVGFFLVFMIVRNVMGHAGYELHPKWWMTNPLTRFNNTTAHHDLHHETAHWNYGLYFTWWDRMMGTEHPDYAERFTAAWANLTPKTKRKKPAIAAVLGLMAALAITPDAQASPLDDVWATPGFGSLVKISACADDPALLCGTVMWLWDATNNDGSPKRDEHNPDKAKQSRALIGTALLTGFAREDETPQGHIYNPEDGRTYRAKIRLREDNVLEVKGCVLVICQTQIWQRAAPVLHSARQALN